MRRLIQYFNQNPACRVTIKVELGVALRTGLPRQSYDQHAPVQLGQVKLEEYAQVFAAAYTK